MFTLSKDSKKCLNCGNPYIQRSMRQKYCGDRKLKIGCSFDVRREMLRKYLSSYVKINRESLQLKSKIWRENNREVLREKNKIRYRLLHPLKIRYVMTPHERVLAARARNKKYYYRHRDRLNKSKTLKTQEKIKSNLGYRILVRMRFRLWDALKNKKKHRRTLDLIGCDIETLKHHIEKQFKSGMSWDNYGRKGWTIDHKFPLSKANLNDEDELKKVCHYTNLQPLWEWENSLKGNRI